MSYDPYWDGTTESTNDGNIISSQEVRNMGLDPGIEFGWKGFGSSPSGGINLFDTAAEAFSDSPFDQILQTAANNNEWSAEQAAIQRRWQEEQNQKAMNFSAEQAAMNRDWQKMMSDTAHQREVVDLQNAGLNPVLSATGGNGASVGSGSAASGVTSAGAKGDTDESSTGAIASYLAQMLAAQTSILNTQTSAQATLASSQLMADANRYAAGLSSAATRYASEQSAAASRYGSELNYEAQMSDPKRYATGYIDSILQSAGLDATSASNIAQQFNVANWDQSNLSEKAKQIAHYFLTDPFGYNTRWYISDGWVRFNTKK